MFRADVLRLLQMDPNVKKPERRLVNDADLTANARAQHRHAAGGGNGEQSSVERRCQPVHRLPGSGAAVEEDRRR